MNTNVNTAVTEIGSNIVDLAGLAVGAILIIVAAGLALWGIGLILKLKSIGFNDEEMRGRKGRGNLG